MEKKLLEQFIYEKNSKDKSKKFSTEKLIKKKVDKLSVKWKGYDNSFNKDVT